MNAAQVAEHKARKEYQKKTQRVGKAVRLSDMGEAKAPKPSVRLEKRVRDAGR